MYTKFWVEFPWPVGTGYESLETRMDNSINYSGTLVTGTKLIDS